MICCLMSLNCWPIKIDKAFNDSLSLDKTIFIIYELVMSHLEWLKEFDNKTIINFMITNW
jgi:sensor c-di-GMP phosphodiesterase-like protein